MKNPNDDLQIIVTDKFDLLSFDTDCELIFTFTRATPDEIAARVSEALHDLNRPAEIKCGVTDKLICKRLTDRRFLMIDRWTPQPLEADFKSDDMIILVGREFDEKTGFELVFGIAEIEVILRDVVRRVQPPRQLIVSKGIN